LNDLNVGARVLVEIGTSADTVFEGDVTAIEYGYQSSQGETLRVRAYDSMHKLRKRQTVRMHVQVTPMDLVKELVAPLGIAVVGAETGPPLRNVMQHEQSDLRLLQEICFRHGLYFFLKGDALQFMTLSGRSSNLKLELGSNLLEANISVNLDPACG